MAAAAALVTMRLALWCALVGAAALPCAALAGNPAQGPGGPVLVITSTATPSGTYYAEILRTEGLNAFAVADIGSVTATTLAAYDVAILARMPVTAAQTTMFITWVRGGGRLIAMAPDARLAGLLGLKALGTTLSNGYLAVDTSTSPGNGIEAQTMQYHGPASLFTLNGATPVATLYSSATTATRNPAVTLRSVNKGSAAAFAFDLADSVIQTRQGNRAWAAHERDGLSPIRSDDKFYGNAQGDPQPDWVDPAKVAIPQADEQQRLLANLILFLNAPTKPLPRFWYFPNGKKAVIVMTGDDHANGGTAGRFDQYQAQSPAGCVVANWECIRSTSYIYSGTPIDDAQVAQYIANGFEVGLHINTGCLDFDLPGLQGIYDQQAADFMADYPSAGTLRTERHHCAAFSDWSTVPQVELAHGIRLDTTYYAWPPGWVNDVPGVFTGSAMPMRFTQPDGSLLDVYMAATQMTDESGQSYPKTVDTLLDRAVGEEGYYGAYTVNAHTDLAESPESDAVVASALARGVPIVSAQQMLAWLDARNASTFTNTAYTNASGTLNFSIAKDPAAAGLQGMLPLRSGTRVLTSLKRSGSAVAFSSMPVKGQDYALFAADAGAYVAKYTADTSGPTVVSTTPAAGATGVDPAAPVSAVFSEGMTASTVSAATVELRDAGGNLVAAGIGYDSARHAAVITPAGPLAPLSNYAATVRGGPTGPVVKDAAGNALAASVIWSFTTGTPVPPGGCPCEGWPDTTTPTNPQFDDPNGVEVGVKFSTDLSGWISSIRFYKGGANTGPHVGNLWAADGTLLGSVTFTGETASGWQTANIAAPVPISAGQVYVASYYAPAGHYAADPAYFAGTSVDKGPLHLLQDGINGGNGVYQYGSASVFPASSYNATNYWVDVIFTTVAPPQAPVHGPALSALSTLPASSTASTAMAGGQHRAAGLACDAPANAIVAENCLPGNPASQWDVSGVGDTGIQGFATDISVNRGGTVQLKIKTRAPGYRVDIYRMGYYGGQGARQVASFTPPGKPPKQPACAVDAPTGLVDCGTWSVAATWAVPAAATSGIYFAKLVRSDNGGASHVFFIVRDDGGTAPLLFQTSDTTWQAYNDFNGQSLYTGSPANRAYKVSYNRPFVTRGVDNGQDWVFNAEYPMVRWLEANGYDMSYMSALDSDRMGALIRNHKVFMSVGHDEYWSDGQRTNVTAARDAGVNLAFFSGNESFWKTRWEASIDGSGTPYRTLVCYKETLANAKIDPTPTWTGSWRDPRFSPPADGGRPENALMGTLYMVNDGATTSIIVPAADGKMRFWRNTAVAAQAPGGSVTLPNGTLGYEWDVAADNAVRPPGLVPMSTTTVNNAPVLQDYGSTYAPGTATHALTLYKAASGARVFGAGTVQWPWGLDATHDRAGTPTDANMQQATVNLLADMGAQPGSLQAGLVAATASTDAQAPASVITSPPAGANLPAGVPVVVSGTATDAGGGAVGTVDVSVDGGATWHPAPGRANWSYRWVPGASGNVQLLSRAADDSGNVETPGPGVGVTVTPQVCPCTLFAASDVPGTPSDPDKAATNLGVQFTADRNGSVSGIRFYKGTANKGKHVGALWTAGGSLLASAPFKNETASGWQQVTFTQPVPIVAGTTYVASYLAPVGRYAADNGFFTSSGTDNPPLHAPAGVNGVYVYSSALAFPNSTFEGTNYWVDVVFGP